VTAETAITHSVPLLKRKLKLLQNYRRVAEVWMDEYKEYLYNRRPHYRSLNPGDLGDQLAIRKRLKCKPFSWFIKEVAFDLTKKYPPVEPPSTASGEVITCCLSLCQSVCLSVCLSVERRQLKAVDTLSPNRRSLSCWKSKKLPPTIVLMSLGSSRV